MLYAILSKRPYGLIVNNSEFIDDELFFDDELFEFEDDEIPKKVKIGRNEPCPCGSGKKFKKCCMGKEV